MSHRRYYVQAVGTIIAGWLEADRSGEHILPRGEAQNSRGWRVDVGDRPRSGVVLDRGELRQAMEYAQQLAERWT